MCEIIKKEDNFVEIILKETEPLWCEDKII